MIQGGRLLMKDDLKTPPPELKLEPGEEAMFVPIDTRSIVTSLIVPGDQVMFLVSKTVPGMPTPAALPVPPGSRRADSRLRRPPRIASDAPSDRSKRSAPSKCFRSGIAWAAWK